jgi:hypothetical protein
MNHQHFDRDEVRAALLARAPAVARALLGEPNRMMSRRDELRFGNRGSLSVKVAGPKAGEWYDHEKQEGGDLFKLIERECRCGGAFSDTLARAADLAGVSPKARNGKGYPPFSPRRSLAISPTVSVCSAPAGRRWP